MGLGSGYTLVGLYVYMDYLNKVARKYFRVTLCHGKDSLFDPE